MTEQLTVAGVEIDLKDFKGTTVSAEPIGKPGRQNVYVLEEPLILTRKGRAVSILRCLRGGPDSRPLAVNLDVVLSGGVSRGLRFLGMQQEIELRYHPKQPPAI